jgi:hypothetical protein
MLLTVDGVFIGEKADAVAARAETKTSRDFTIFSVSSLGYYDLDTDEGPRIGNTELLHLELPRRR